MLTPNKQTLCSIVVLTYTIYQIILPDSTQSRWGHTATVVTLYPGLEEVTVCGGTTDNYVYGKLHRTYSKVAETTIITFGELPVTRQSLYMSESSSDYISSNLCACRSLFLRSIKACVLNFSLISLYQLITANYMIVNIINA